jgi:hypothetical protein
VRFVQLFLSGQPWDTHNKNAETLKSLCAETDQPSAALVCDLKQRGLLDETIMLWTGEFGRLPISQKDKGSDHNRHGFSLWLPGGGFKSGYVHGATDEFGYQAVERVLTVHDLQATLLHAFGIDHRKLTYPHEGQLESLTDPEVTKAQVVSELLAYIEVFATESPVRFWSWSARLLRRSAQVAYEEARHVTAHAFVGITFPGIVVAMPEDAFDADWVKLGLDRPAEEGVMDPLARFGIGGKWCVGFGVKQKNGWVTSRDVIQWGCLDEEFVGSR